MSDERYMALAISLGRRNLGQTSPNPSVGCVIVKNDVIVGRGYTAPSGRPGTLRTFALGLVIG